ncbi:hypothetical protein DdX_13951 [Ditylenchus destructor]|uniref:BTB domain-containing protein n=1 Tax=Ditylenchus destructor TaxID=166010 RepID=A0AAD4MVG5_9BILA|nr:hypothetical protein DdX_13951 [Ditylenchus destructor]
MSQASFLFDFNVNELETAQDFPKSNVVELEGSKWYLGIEKKGINDRISLTYWKILDVCLSCERGTPNGIYLVNLALIWRGSLIDVLFTRTYYFKPLDLDMHCFSIDYNYLLDTDNGFIDENGEGKIMAEISVKRVDDWESVKLDADQLRREISSWPQDLNGIINLQGGHRMLVNKELLSRHSKYFDTIFNNENFVESSQESIDLTDFTYNQFRLLHKHIRETRALCTDGSLEFRLKSENGVKEFQRLRTLADVREYCLEYTSLPHRTKYASKNLLKENLCMFDDLKQMGAFTGLIFCVFADYMRRDIETVSAENIEDLLSVGSYFQITKIMDSCKEFLFRKYDYPDFSSDQRMKLVEKYNLTLVKGPTLNPINPLIRQWYNNLAWSTPTILAQLTFLDTGKAYVCCVEFIYGMTIQTIYFDALTSLYFKRVCDDWFDPLDYKMENMRISDLEMSAGLEYKRKDIDDNPALMLDHANPSRIYIFDVRRIQSEGNSLFETEVLCWKLYFGMIVEKLLSIALWTFYTRDKEDRVSLPSNYKLEAAHASMIQPDTVSLDIPYPTKFDFVLTSHRYNFGVRLKAVQDAFDSSSQDHQRLIDSGPQSVDDIPGTSKLSINMHSLEISDTQKILLGKNLPDIVVHVTFLDTGVDEMCAVPYQNGMNIQRLLSDALTSLYFKNKSSSPCDYKLQKVGISNLDSASGGQPEASFLHFQGPMLGQVLTTQMYKFEVRLKSGEHYLGSEEMLTTSKKINRMPIEIMVLLTFLDTGDLQVCKVPYKVEMSVQKLLFIAFMTLKDNRFPWQYDIESVYASDSDIISDGEPHSLDLQDIEAIAVNSSYAYSFVMRRKTNETSTSKEK